MSNKSSYDKLFTPMNIGNVQIKNRIVMAPMCMGFGQYNGCATEKMMNYYEERAKGGVGLIFTEITRINDVTGASSFGQLGMSHDYQIPALQEMARRIHRHGCKIMVELHHPGRQNLGLMIGTVPLCVAGDKIMGNLYTKILTGAVIPPGKKLQDKHIVPRVAAPSKCEQSKMSNSVSKPLSTKGVKKIIAQFIEGAVRVKKAGCDGVELHASHGYLIQQFLSPNTNKRTDEYGGSLENRMRFLCEIIDGIRKNCGSDFPIVVRLTVDEMYDRIGQPNKGYGITEGLKMAKILSDKGIDAIDVSSGAYDTFNYWLEPTTFECGWRKNLAQEVKKVVDIPVIAANLIRSPQQAEKQLDDGVQDFIALGRPLIADPHWVQKVQNGDENKIKRCVCCLYCFESMMENAYKYSHGHCSVNPFVGRERDKFEKNGSGRRVVVVGAGAAGLTVAELLARRGFCVTVLEKESSVGGQLNLADKPPHKDKLSWVCTDLLENVMSLGVDVVFNTKADKNIIDSYNPEIVINATGGNAIHPKAFSAENVVTVTEVLDGSVNIENKKVAVIGSGMTGLETSELLVSKGNKVTVVEMADTIAPGAWFQHVDDAMPVLKKAGVKFMTGEKLISTDGKVITENVKSKEKTVLDVDYTVLSLGVKPDVSLYDEIKESKDYKVYNIGDSAEIGRIANATESAYQLAVSL
ncbi:MAG: FAD-dependent oxidoreductase [Clostridiales bacterium]|nr:FAD-dependent oxidoreductase [Clostridiales bacterium]